ncbi:MAG: hypothetical protein HZA08_11195 [Nitrospirae bacterium]|nr:hypothetical protein [Nitrospirota bacterium]
MFYIFFLTLMMVFSNNPVMAEDTYTETFQGVISSTEGIPQYLIVNEKKVLISNNAEVKDHKDREIELSDIKVGKWVYLVVEKKQAGLTVNKIYLLPKRIKDSEKHNYPFIGREEEGEE